MTDPACTRIGARCMMADLACICIGARCMMTDRACNHGRLMMPKIWRKRRDHVWKRQFVYQ